MFVPAKRNFPICSREKGVFKKRLAESLRLRMYPHTGLQAKQLAAALGVSPDTIHHWLRAENTADGENTGALIRFFATQGDHAFIAELFPEGVTPLIAKAKKAERAMAFIDSFKDVLTEGAAA